MPYLLNSLWNTTAVIVIQTILSLVLFSAIIATLVFFIRPHVRKYKPVDLKIFDRLQPLIGPRTNRFMLFITLLGKHQFLIPANFTLIFYFLLTGNQSWFSVRVATIALSSLVLMFLLKYLFRRKRPLAPLLSAARGLSFPSGHAIMAVTFYGLIIYIINHSLPGMFLRYILTGLLIILIILIGFSRVYLRVHYASDVLAGFIIGIIWLVISLGVLERIEQGGKEQVRVVFLREKSKMTIYSDP